MPVRNTTPRGTEHCDHCGLPLFARKLGPEPSGEPQYCCVGCQQAAAVHRELENEGSASWTMTRLGLSVFFAMNVMAFTMALWTFHVYGEEGIASTAGTNALAELFRYLCLLFAVPVLLLLGGPLLQNALAQARRGQFSTDLLLLLGVIASFVYSTVSLGLGRGDLYFEVGVMVLVAVTLGRWLEATGKLKTTATLHSLEKLLPAKVCVVAEHGEEDTTILRENVQVGQRVRVLHGQRIPTDGRIHLGSADVDEQIITGESQPRSKQVGDERFAATRTVDGNLVVEVTAASNAGVLRRLLDVVDAAAAQKGHEQRLADRIAAWFVPLVVVASLSTLFWHGLSGRWTDGMLASLAVVVIACPCALGIATPLAVWAGLGRAARGQVLFRHGDAVSRLARVTAVCFDKTGTLTTGEPDVEHFVSDRSTPVPEILKYAVSLAAASSHSLSAAICRYASTSSSPASAETVTTIPGKGVIAELDGNQIYLGSLRLMDEAKLVCDPTLKRQLELVTASGQPLACIGWEGVVRGVFVFRERLRSEALQAVRQLRRAGLQMYILTGDYAARATTMTRTLGIQTITDLLPAEKLQFVSRLQQSCGVVAMIGDGINDTPALAAADVGIAMGCGADVTRETADVCLLGNDLTSISCSIDLARQTVHAIRRNLFWAFLYNGCGIAFAAAGLLNPVLAAVAMVGSSLFVVASSLRLASGSDEALQSPAATVDMTVADDGHEAEAVPGWEVNPSHV